MELGKINSKIILPSQVSVGLLTALGWLSINSIWCKAIASQMMLPWWSIEAKMVRFTVKPMGVIWITAKPTGLMWWFSVKAMIMAWLAIWVEGVVVVIEWVWVSIDTERG